MNPDRDTIEVADDGTDLALIVTTDTARVETRLSRASARRLAATLDALTEQRRPVGRQGKHEKRATS